MAVNRGTDKSRLAVGAGLSVGRHILFWRVLASSFWLVPLLLLAIAGWQTWDQELRLSRVRVRSALAILAEEAEKVFEAQELMLDWIDSHVRSQNWNEIEHSVPLHKFLSELNDKSDYIDSIWLFDANGNARATTRVFPIERPVNVIDRDYFESVKSGKPGIDIGRPAVGRMTGTFALHVVKSRIAPDGRFDGVILLALSPRYFEQHFPRSGDGEIPSVMLMRADGVVLASNHGPSPGTSLPAGDPYIARIRAKDVAANIFEARVNGENRIAGIQRLRNYPVYVSYSVNVSSVRAELWVHLGVFGIVAVMCSVILLGTSLLAVRIAYSEQRALRGWNAEAEQRQLMQAQMRQAFKMEALGRMAGGIAHHFNNLLPALTGLLEQTLSEVPRASVTFERVGRMIDAIAQGRQMVRQILVFGRREILVHDAVSMVEIVEAALALFEENLPPNATTGITRLSDGRVLGDRAQLQEAALNVLSNAIHAIGLRSGGHIEFVVENIKLDELQASRFSVQPGDYVRIACRDNGIGMSEEVVERAFDPFYTTKPVDEGTGLGLAITHGIVAGHRGGVHIESELGVGTTVTIYLPQAASAGVAVARWFAA
jgi:signal transduction histidine kinase